jgi:hypothetical protein
MTSSSVKAMIGERDRAIPAFLANDNPWLVPKAMNSTSKSATTLWTSWEEPSSTTITWMSLRIV